MPCQHKLPRTAAGGHARRILAGHFVAELERVQCDRSSVELAQKKINGEKSAEEGIEKKWSQKDKERPGAS